MQSSISVNTIQIYYEVAIGPVTISLQHWIKGLVFRVEDPLIIPLWVWGMNQ